MLMDGKNFILNSYHGHIWLNIQKNLLDKFSLVKEMQRRTSYIYEQGVYVSLQISMLKICMDTI